MLPTVCVVLVKLFAARLFAKFEAKYEPHL